MKPILAFTLIILVSLAGCKSNSAYSFSERIVQLERNMVPDIERTESNVEQYLNAGNYDSVAVAGERMESIIQKSIDTLNKTPPPSVSGAVDFKTASITYFKFLKSIYTSYRNYGLQTTDEGRELEKTKLLQLVDKKQQAVADMQAAQKKYADANGFKIKQD